MNEFRNKLSGFLKTLILPVAVYLLFGALSGGRTFNSRALITALRTAVQPSIICYALLLGMSTGVMNFSAGAVVVCAAIVGSGLSTMLGLGLPGFCILAIVIALACNTLYGLLYNWLRVPGMVLGLGMLLVFEAMPRLFFPGGGNMDQKSAYLARSPWIFIVMAITMVVFYVLYNLTPFGHNLRAVGANQSVALAAGLNLDKIKLLNSIVGGLFLGIAAILHMSNQGKLFCVSNMGSMTVMMDGFMGVFLGMLLSRWSDPSFAVFCGVLTMKVMSAGFIAVGLPQNWKDVVTGFFMLIVMAISANAMLPTIKKANKAYAAEAEKERLADPKPAL